MRKLYIIPILHTQSDLGSIAGALEQISVVHMGLAQWRQRVQTIQDLWREIRREVESWELPYPDVRLYQDGLPICGRELDIATELASAGSPNHQLLLALVQRGATLMGTESPELLLAEYNSIQQWLAARASLEVESETLQQALSSSDLLQRRDAFIAQRISETLCEGEVGLLFLGALHSIGDWIEKDIEFSYPLFYLDVSDILKRYPRGKEEGEHG